MIKPTLKFNRCNRCKKCGKELPEKKDYCDECSEIISQKIKQRLLLEAGITGILNNMTFNSFDSKIGGKVYDIAKDFAETFDYETKNGLILCGAVGSGKTHLAIAITKHLIEQKQIPVIFTEIIDLLQEIRETYNSDENYRVENEKEIIKKYSEIPLLIIDDLGSEKITDWVRQILYQIINKRWIEQKPLIITTNLTIEQLESRLSKRTASRIVSICDKIIEMRDYDYRVKKP